MIRVTESCGHSESRLGRLISLRENLKSGPSRRLQTNLKSGCDGLLKDIDSEPLRRLNALPQVPGPRCGAYGDSESEASLRPSERPTYRRGNAAIMMLSMLNAHHAMIDAATCLSQPASELKPCTSSS